MSHDIVIRGGLVVDGTGADPLTTDVAVDGDRITAVGLVPDPGTREIDASGRLVTPGFVDIHTHLDAQLAWDPMGTSSCWHGVTTVVLGNCGVTFAPCKAHDRRYLAELMESVEDIPADSIMEGLPWTWETYGGYLDAVDSFPKGINAGGMVGHCAVRYHAMGERSLSEEPASDEDIGRMRELVDEAIGAGSLGFSTSRTALHRVPDGRPVPGTHAEARELMAIAGVMEAAGRGVFEAAPRLGEKDGAGLPKTVAEIEMLADISIASGRPVTFGLTQTKIVPPLHTTVLDTVASARERGANLRPQTTARGIGLLFGLVHRTPYDGSPEWRELRQLPLPERLAALGTPSRRSALVTAGQSAPTISADDMFVLPEGDARYVLGPDDTLGAHARRLGVSPVEAFIELSLRSEGRALVNWPFLNDDIAGVETMLRHPASVLGLADAGAHVGMIMDSSQPTFFLTHWVRDGNLCGIAEAVRRLSSDTAELFGIDDRGVLRDGAFADVNVINLGGMRLPQPEYVADFPGGAGRFVQRGIGYDYTLVNGQVFMERGEHTGALPGRLIRS